MNTDEIMNKNTSKLKEFFEGIVSCDYYNGMSYQLYLDLDDNTMRIYEHISDSTWNQRSDESLVLLYKVSGYSDIPENERYNEECDLMDFGYYEWLEEIQDKLSEYSKE